MKISDVKAIEILDSRGKPTVRAFVTLDDGSVHSASVPSGASTGTYEAVELRDGDKAHYLGQGVQKAVANVNTVIRDAVKGMDVSDPEAIDRKMIAVDGTENKGNLGANAILSVSEAVTRAGAHANKQPLWQFINEYYFKETRPNFPRLMANIINGGKHASWNFDFQEFMVLPRTNKPSDSVRIASDIFHILGKDLKSKGLSTLVGDEGGYSPALSSNDEAFATILQSVKDAGYENGKDLDLGLDAAASEFYVDGKYVFKKTNQSMSGPELVEYYKGIQKQYSILSFEDAFAEDDWDNFKAFTEYAQANGAITIGDDLYVTNVKRLQKGIEMKASNGILIKLNQIGSVSETVAAIKMARMAGFKIAISHRSGETEDPFIADLAYGSAGDFLKAGSLSRSERLAKYNRLIEIENGL